MEKLPLWLAPNLITILGLVCNVLTALILIYHNPDAKDTYSPPRWAYLMCAIGLFVYQTLDAIGKTNIISGQTVTGKFYSLDFDLLTAWHALVVSGSTHSYTHVIMKYIYCFS